MVSEDTQELRTSSTRLCGSAEADEAKVSAVFRVEDLSLRLGPGKAPFLVLSMVSCENRFVTDTFR